MKYLLLVFLVISKLEITYSQNISLDSLYNSATKDYQNSKYLEAENGLMEVIKIDSNHIDALFNLGGINLKLERLNKAIFYFQKAAKLKDYEAAKILVKELNVKLENTEFINIEFVNEPPTFEYKSKSYIAFDSESLKLFNRIIEQHLKASIIIGKSKFKGTVYVKFEIDKTGKLNCQILKGTGDLHVDEEVKEMFENSVHFVPAKYDSKNAGVGTWNMPVRF